MYFPMPELHSLKSDKRIVQLNKNRTINIVSNFSQCSNTSGEFCKGLFMCSFQFRFESIEIPEALTKRLLPTGYGGHC